MSVSLLSPLQIHVSFIGDKHNSSHSTMCETVCSLLGSEVRAVHTGCPHWPSKGPILGPCVCVSVSPHPGSSPGPGKSLGHTDSDLSSATLRLIPDFMGAGEGEGLGRLRPAGASWVPAPTPRDLIVPLVVPPRAATWEGSHFIVTPWHQNVTINSKVQRQCTRQMSPQWTGYRSEASVPALVCGC